MKKNIEIDPNIQKLFGTRDENLQVLEDGLSVSIHLKSDSVQIEGATDVASAPMQIRFDPKMLRLNDVVRGEFLSSDGQQPVFTKNIMNDAGVAPPTRAVSRPTDNSVR